MLLCSTDTLWDFAAAELRTRESRTADDEKEEDSTALCERTVLFMGSKAGVNSHKQTDHALYVQKYLERP